MLKYYNGNNFHVFTQNFHFRNNILQIVLGSRE